MENRCFPFVYPHWYTLPEIYKYICIRASQETDHSPCPRKQRLSHEKPMNEASPGHHCPMLPPTLTCLLLLHGLQVMEADDNLGQPFQLHLREVLHQQWQNHLCTRQGRWMTSRPMAHSYQLKDSHCIEYYTRTALSKHTYTDRSYST